MFDYLKDIKHVFYNLDMDKRLAKTRESLYEAFRLCLLEKDYESISVSDILSKSGVSRSTFYAHFSSKEDVLKGVLGEIFDHVFSPTHEKEKDHDFSMSPSFDYSRMITHVFYHFYDERELIKAILLSKASSIFVESLKEHSLPLISACVKSHTYFKEDIPLDMQIHQLTESFVSLIRFWVESGCLLSPEELTEYFNKLYA